jgi:hypothetical protein
MIGRSRSAWTSFRIVMTAGVALAAAAAFPGAALAAVPSTLAFNHNGTACASKPGTNSLPTGMSQTGIAFDGSRLLVSCWGDTTITSFSPSSPSTSTVTTVHGTMIGGGAVKAFGALAYDRGSGTLWACASASNAGSGSPENKMSEVGTINLSTATYTPVFTSHGCDNGLAFDFGTTPARAHTLWTSADIATTIYNYSTSGTQLASQSVSSLLGASAANSGIAIGGGNFYLANPQTTTKRVYQVAPDFSSSTQVLSSSHRYEDMECDDVTYGSQTVIWVMWFNQNVLKPLKISGTCTSSGPPPPPPGTVEIGDGGFSPTTIAATQGNAVNFQNTGTVSHSVADNTGLNLFSSGPLSPGATFSYTYTAAGSYGIIDSTTNHTATVKVPLIAPSSGTQNVAFTITWASAAPASGLAEDIQVMYPGTTSWVAWLSKQTGTSGSFTPTHGSGTYKFRARLRTTASGTTFASAYSAAKSVSVN